MSETQAGPSADGAYFESADDGPAPDGGAGFGPLDAIYCISLREQPRRREAAARHFRDIGLAPVTFYRPLRGLHPPLAIWTSHREVARRALAMGHSRVLILEDDVRFSASADRLCDRLARGLARAPANWNGIFLGHFPLQAYPVACGLVRTRSVLAHAYVANRRLLRWLADSEPMDPAIPVCARFGAGVDAAFANLPDMYALWPMIAEATPSEELRPDCDRALAPGLARLFDGLFYRNLFMFHGNRAAEAVATVLSPWHALTLEFFSRRSGRAVAARAVELRAQGFDPAAYLLAHPDVAATGEEPLGQYLRVGAREGRNPFPPLKGFDPQAYLRANPDVAKAGMDPVHHYLNYGRPEGRAMGVQRPDPATAD